MRCVVLLLTLITTSAPAENFAARVDAGKIALAGAEGQSYETSFGPAIRKALLPCAAMNSTSQTNGGKFTFVADVSRSGSASSIEVDPVTSVSRCFAQHFAGAQLPPPPRMRNRSSMFPVTDTITLVGNQEKEHSLDVQHVPDSDIAIAVAGNFLKTLDEGNASATWPNLSDQLKSRVSQSTWTRTLVGLRLAVGSVKKRNLQGAVFMTKLADAPVGQYYIIQFNTDFANVSAGEKVVLSLEHGEWKMLGYFLSRNVSLKLP